MTTTTTTQTRRPVTRWLTATCRAFWHLNEELTGAGEAMARSNRFRPPGLQAGAAEAERVYPARTLPALMRI